MLRLALLLLLLLAAEISWAQLNDDAKKCASEAERNGFDLAIRYCTGVIESGELSGPELAPVLISRASAYQQKRQYDQALADYEAVTELDPKFAAERSKGFLFFYLGRMTRSAESFEKYIRSEPHDIMVILFRYLAEAKIGNALAAARDLEGDAAKLKERNWPAPIIDFHLGRIDEKAMFAAANDPDPMKRSEKTCAANFHAGEARLLRAHLTAAIALLRAAEKECPSHLTEAHAASTELKRLGQKR